MLMERWLRDRKRGTACQVVCVLSLSSTNRNRGNVEQLWPQREVIFSTPLQPPGIMLPGCHFLHSRRVGSMV